jgi:hypothetical protein|tara:strand:- start:275 stop:574 length:300 start_codon:yes stop_codon:yes gene_type:complete
MLMSLSLWAYDVVRDRRPLFEDALEDNFMIGLALDSAMDELCGADDTFDPVLEPDHVSALTWFHERLDELRRERDEDYDELDGEIQLIKRTINNYMARG